MLDKVKLWISALEANDKALSESTSQDLTTRLTLARLSILSALVEALLELHNYNEIKKKAG